MKIILAVIAVVVLGQVEAGTRIAKGNVVNQARRSTVAIFSYIPGAATGDPGTIDHFCSGALIHPEWVLTSASCVKMVEQYNMRVTTLDINVMTDAIYNGANVLLIKNKIAHPSFTNITYLNDIGLIQVEDHMDKSARLLKLPQTAIDVTNTQATVRGYGENKLVPVADNLKQKERTDVFIVDNSNCVAKDIVMTNKLCTMDPVACTGDQGGPLILGGTNTIVGVVSLSDKYLEFCDLQILLRFTAYTNVWIYRPWILTTTGLNL